MNFDNKLEYIVYDDVETFVLIDKKTGYRDYYNKRRIFSLLELLLNLSEEELNSLENYINCLKYILPISKKPYYKEKQKLKKAKKYIDKSISNSFYADYNIFKLACELKYFKEVTSKQFHDLEVLDLEERENVPYDYFERIDYIYKCFKKKKIEMITAYELKDFEDFIVASMTELFKNKKNIKKCENCGKYFVPKRNDAKYCYNTSPQDENKTCKQYAIEKNYNDKLAKDEITALYRKIYKRLNKDKERNQFGSHIANFESFKNEAKDWKQKIKTGKKTNEEYFEWLKKEDSKKDNLI